ncbi:hypothetical protein JCM16303_003670 [Sporobolomyces ruberrimus]
MFGSFASTSTSTSRHHLSGDPLAFLDSGKYVTMIREVFPSSSRSKPSLPLASSSSSSSNLARPTWDNQTPSSFSSMSYSSSTSASSDEEEEEEELETPPSSPLNSLLSLPQTTPDLKGKQSINTLGFPFSLDEIAEDEDARGPSFNWISAPTVPSSHTVPLSPTSPSLDESLSLPPIPLSKPKPTTKGTPNRPTRQEEERYRGRTRSPRLLWRSDLDKLALELLDEYHEKTVGGKLPVLRIGMGRKEVREWSKKVEDAGI